MANGITKIKVRIKELAEQMKRDGEAALKEAFSELFAAQPTIQAVRWQQYTPYFNDGETCEFSVSEFGYKPDGMTEDAGENRDGFISSYYWSGASAEEKWLNTHVRQFESEVRCEDIFQSVFGDHVVVTATREGFTVEKYDHE